MPEKGKKMGEKKEKLVHNIVDFQVNIAEGHFQK